MSHPIRLVVSDDLQRSRATVFFRLLLAIPHFVVLLLWGVVAYLATILNWFAALFTGAVPQELHGFVARYLRYATQVGAYVALLADPYPRFGGGDDYPVDLQIAPPAPQNRWKTLFRIVLALPAILIAALLTNGFWNGETGSGAYFQQTGGLLATVAVLGWFASLALASMPRGLRDAGAYGLSYAAQVHAYLLLLTDRYPNSNPLAALGDLPTGGEEPIRLVVEDDLRRSRVTVFFRLVLAIPHILFVWLWGIGAVFATIANWFATLFAGRSPAGLHNFLASYLRYATHVAAYIYLTANPFPSFADDPGSYPIELVVDDRQPQDRAKTVFRLPLAFPAFLIGGAYSSIALVAAVFGWFVSLFRAEMPLGLRNAQALSLRYNQQTYAYMMLLTDRYPYSGPVDAAAAPAAEAPPVFLPPDAQAQAQAAFGQPGT